MAANPLAAAVAEANGLDLIVLEKACRDARPAHPQAIPQKPKAKHRRRGAQPGKPKRLTPRQAEVVQVVGECKGGIAERRPVVSAGTRKTIAETYKAAMAKMGKEVVRFRDKTRLLPRDKHRTRGHFRR